MAQNSEQPTELFFDRLKDGQRISVRMQVEGDQVQLEVGADPRTDRPAQTLACSIDQWQAIRYAAEWYYHALAESETEDQWANYQNRGE